MWRLQKWAAAHCHEQPGAISRKSGIFEGTVGSQGELAMKYAAPVHRDSVGVERTISGRIDGNGTARARQMGYYCSYDLVWQKALG
jgi:hypothetical protein